MDNLNNMQSRNSVSPAFSEGLDWHPNTAERSQSFISETGTDYTVETSLTTPRNMSQAQSAKSKKSTSDRNRKKSAENKITPEKTRKTAAGCRTNEQIALTSTDNRQVTVNVSGREWAKQKNQKIKDNTRSRNDPDENQAKKKTCWTTFKGKLNNLFNQLELWRGSFKVIEGHFGSGVVSYFTFLKFLLLVNIAIFSIIFIFVVLPGIIFKYEDGQGFSNSTEITERLTLTNSCHVNYTASLTKPTEALDYFLDVLQGTGFMVDTILFYGKYDYRRLKIGSLLYSMSLSYIVLTLIYLSLSLFVMVLHSIKQIERTLTETKTKDHKYSEVAFCSWDYCLTNEKSSLLKHKSLSREITSEIEHENRMKEMAKMTGCQKFGLYLVRLIVNIIVICLLGGAGVAIYYITFTVTEVLQGDVEHMDQFLKLAIEYAPSLAIMVLNFIIPMIFVKLVILERYGQNTELLLTLVRTVFLRLASLFLLMVTIYTQVRCGTPAVCSGGQGEGCPTFQCWETYFGQQIYKLVVVNFFAMVAVTFLVDFPRKLIVTKCSCKLTKWVGLAEFEIPDHVLNLVYTQSLCWLGTFFCPLIPGMTVVTLITLFYCRKISTLYTYQPSSRAYKAAKSQHFFILVLMLSFGTVCCGPIGFIIWQMEPSKGCGPFRIYDNMWSIIPLTVDDWPQEIRDIVQFATAPATVAILFVTICLLAYYQAKKASAGSRRIEELNAEIFKAGKERSRYFAENQRLRAEIERLKAANRQWDQ